MKTMILLAMVFVPALTGMSFAQTTLTVESCQPLTAENSAACCSAPNWRDITLPEAQAFCARSTDQNTQQQLDDDAVGSVTTPPAGTVSTPGERGHEPTVSRSNREQPR